MYGSQEDIRHNLKMFFLDGITGMPSFALISISAVIPYFLAQLGASTFQIALATAMTMICVFIMQPVFGYIASNSVELHKTFGKIILIQRSIFLVFVLSIPFFSENHALLINVFLVFWCIFNLFVGSYFVFHTPLVIRLLPPDKRGTIRGVGFAAGSFIGVGMTLLIPVILGRIEFPYNYMVIFALGTAFLLVNSSVFFFMRQSKNPEPAEATGILRYIKRMPSSIAENPPFRAMILTCIFLVITTALLPYFTLYAIREFYATDTNIATFAGLAILAGAISYVIFGFLVDRRGPRFVLVIIACFIFVAGLLALVTNSLNILFISWFMVNISNSGAMIAVSLLIGEICPSDKLPVYVGVYFTITNALSAFIVLVLAPVLENIGFKPLFAIVLICGFMSLMINLFVLKKRMTKLDLNRNAG